MIALFCGGVGPAYTPVMAEALASNDLKSSKARKSSMNSSDAWRMFSKCLNQYDEEMVKGWRDEMDGLLIFAAVAATATVFTSFTLAFIFGTIILPVFFVNCPYRSPQATVLGSSLRIAIGWIFVIFTVLVVVLPYTLSVLLCHPLRLYIERYLWNPLVITSAYLRFKNTVGTAQLDGWKHLDRAVLDESEDLCGLLETKVLEKVDETYAGNDQKLAEGLLACIAEMKPNNAADCLRTVFSHRRGGISTVNLLMPQVISLVEQMDVEDANGTKKVLKVVNELNKNFRYGNLTAEPSVLVGFQQIQHLLAGHLAQFHDDSDVTPKTMKRMFYYLNNSLIVSFKNKAVLPMKWDSQVFQNMTRALVDCSSSRKHGPIFYTACRMIIKLAVLPDIDADCQPTLKGAVEDLFHILQSSLKERGLCDPDGSVEKEFMDVCYLPFVVALLDELDTFAEKYPAFTSVISDLVSVLADRVNRDIADNCPPFSYNGMRFVNYLDVDHDQVHHSEKKSIQGRAKQWALRMKTPVESDTKLEQMEKDSEVIEPGEPLSPQSTISNAIPTLSFQ
ncbi:hypothetical protein ABKN59_009759 [Abortiporus biennis]